MSLKPAGVTPKGTVTKSSSAPGPVAEYSGGLEFWPLQESDVFKPRLIISATAKQKVGKTHFGLTMPEPIAYFQFENGLEGVGCKPEFKSKRIDKVAFDWERPTKATKGSKRVIEQAQKASDKFQLHWDHAVRNYRSVIMDTTTHIWEMFRIAEFGKVGEVMPHHYAPVNAEFRSFIDAAMSSSINLLMIHRVKDEYKDNKPTGRLVRDGYKGAEYDAQVCIWMDRDFGPKDTDPTKPPSGLFYFQVHDCRQNPDLVGQTFVQPDNTFIDLAVSVYPEIDPGVWL